MALLLAFGVAPPIAAAGVTNPFAFGPAQTTSPGSGLRPVDVAVADFNKDGQPDIVTANGNSSDTVSVMLAGASPPYPTYDVGPDPNHIAVEDLNHDGYPDIVVTNSTGSLATSAVTVLLNDPSNPGTFLASQSYGVGIAPAAITIGDLNNDNHPDIVTANNQGNNVSVLLNDGDGTFADAQNYAVGSTPNGVVIGDFNNDNVPDIAATSFGPTTTTGSTVSVLYGTGSGTFGVYQPFPAGPRPFRLVTGDFNGDNHTDLAVLDWPSSIDSTGTDAVQVLLNNGQTGAGAGFDPPSQAAVFPNQSPSVVPWIASGDIDKDGNQDFVFGDGFNAYVAPGNGDGTFGSLASVGTGTANQGVLDDMNGDHYLDLVTSNQVFPDGSVSVYLHELPPVNQTAPSLPHTALVGEELDGWVGTWTGLGTVTYAWQIQRCDSSGNSCSDALGEAGSADPIQYVPTDGDAGYTLRVGVTASNGAGSTGPVYSGVTDLVPPPPVATTAPQITGTPQVGHLAHIVGDQWNMLVTRSFTWYLCNPDDTDPSDWQSECFYAFANTYSATIPSYVAGYRIEGVVKGSSDTNGVGYATTNLISVLGIYPNAVKVATASKSYSLTLQAYGGTAPYTWTADPATLPPGLSMSPDGTLSGTPTAAGSFKAKLTVTDSETPSVSETKAYIVKVLMLIKPPTLPKGHVGQAYSQTLTAAGSNGAVTWTTNPASLPPGLSLSSDGTLSGAPTTSGTYSFNVQATDSASPADTATRAYTVKVS
jgi:hypothetical protein